MAVQPACVAELIELANAGQPFKYVYFWGHRPNPDGSVGKGCFSQWWPAAFDIAEVSYPTAEHYMMAAKARLFGDAEAEARILQANSPGHAKSIGREVRGFELKRWVEHRDAIVFEANLAKFSQNDELAAFLLGTKNRVLVEASPVDAIWGVGLAATDPAIATPAQWKGLNLLGFALMKVRQHLQERQ